MADPKSAALADTIDEEEGFTTLNGFAEDLEAEDTDAKMKLSKRVRKMIERQEESDAKAEAALRRTTQAIAVPPKNGNGAT